jgi:rubrerythrin
MTNQTQLSPPIDAIEVHGDTRQAFLLKATLATSAAYGSMLVGPAVRRAFAQSGGMNDVDILNYALTLEYLEADFYRVGAKLNLSADVEAAADRFGGEEAEHVKAITQTITDLGGKPVASPRFTFPMKNQRTFMALANTLEDTGVSAYNGAGPMIQSKDVLAAAGSIVQVEARHAAAIRVLRGRQPAPDAFDKPLSEGQVVKAITPLIRS